MPVVLKELQMRSKLVGLVMCVPGLLHDCHRVKLSDLFKVIRDVSSNQICTCHRTILIPHVYCPVSQHWLIDSEMSSLVPWHLNSFYSWCLEFVLNNLGGEVVLFWVFYTPLLPSVQHLLH